MQEKGEEKPYVEFVVCHGINSPQDVIDGIIVT